MFFRTMTVHRDCPLPPDYTEKTTSSAHLVTRAEMMSVMSALSLLSSSSMGPGRGSCLVRCSQRRICCRFCQIRSASFSHLVDRGCTGSVEAKGKRKKKKKEAGFLCVRVFRFMLFIDIVYVKKKEKEGGKALCYDWDRPVHTRTARHPVPLHEDPRCQPVAASSSTG